MIEKNDFVSQGSEQCIEHPNSTIIIDKINGDKICKKCGIIVNDDYIYREYDPTQETSDRTHRSVADITQDDHGLGVPLATIEEIKEQNSKKGNKVTIANIEFFERVHKEGTAWNFTKRRSHQDVKRNNSFQTIKNICTRKQLPFWVNQSGCDFYVKVIEKNNLSKYKNDKRLAAACVYYVCKNSNEIRINIDELSKIINDSSKKIIKDYNYIYRQSHEKNNSIENSRDGRKNKIYQEITQCELEIPEKLRRKSLKWLYNPKFEETISGSDEKSIAAGIICVICKINNLKITPKKIANKFEISQNTVRNQAKNIAELLGIVFLDRRKRKL
ncbi:MAG: transcription initiation factor IIB family protein [Candidatus Nitrosopelagicus sp.]|jgi:transcription initiation factor TFIIIB Brf1 subunit/transcription initiation factor TFIIB|nr:transcription initiation factor IIB family protein [Candidatus Nitrosopelagicus sp.]